MFHIGPTDPTHKLAQEQVRNVLNTVQRLGFTLEFREEDVTQILEIQSKMTACCGTEQLVDKIAQMNDVDFFTKQTIEQYAETLSMSDTEFQEQQELRAAFRRLLLSLIS
jgi:L-lysine 2,3-aminomutase